MAHLEWRVEVISYQTVQSTATAANGWFFLQSCVSFSISAERAPFAWPLDMSTDAAAQAKAQAALLVAQRISAMMKTLPAGASSSTAGATSFASQPSTAAPVSNPYVLIL